MKLTRRERALIQHAIKHYEAATEICVRVQGQERFRASITSARSITAFNSGEKFKGPVVIDLPPLPSK